MTDKLDELFQRHSVRSYTDWPIDNSTRNKLQSEATYINTHQAGLNFQLCFGDNKVFNNFFKNYGTFKGVDNYLVALVDNSFEHALERSGYYAQQFVMEAVKIGLGTCFVGSSFDRGAIKIHKEVYEEVPFLITLGYSSNNDSLTGSILRKITHLKAISPRELFEGSEEEYHIATKIYPFLDDALKAVACAPSALNKHPVRVGLISIKDWERDHQATSEINNYHLPKDSLMLYMRSTKDGQDAIELGISKFNFQYVADGEWLWGDYGLFIPINIV